MDENQRRFLHQKHLLQRGAAIIDGIQDRFRADGYSNLLNKYGTSQDNSTAYEYQQELITDDLELIRLYEGNGLFAKIIDRPSEEAVKHGLDIDYGDEKIAEYVEDRLDELDFEQQFSTAEKWARLYGGSIIVMLVDDGRGLEEPIDWDNVRSIEELRVFERAIVQPDYSSLYQFHFEDALHDKRPFGEPEYYTVFSIYGYFVVHRSRCLVFRNSRLPEQTTNAIYRYWGIPEYVKIKRALRECVTAHEDGVKLMERSVQAIYKMKNLVNLLATDDGENKVLQRLQVIDMARGILNSIAIDADGENYGFENFSTGGVKEIIDSTCNMLSAVTSIPQTVLFGRSPAGMNATGESDLENYYNMIENIQKQNMKRNVRTLLDLILRQGTLEGKIEEIPKYKVKFAPLWSMSEADQANVESIKANVERTKAATSQAYIDAGIIDPSEVRASLVDDGYLGLEDAELPEGLVPKEAETTSGGEELEHQPDTVTENTNEDDRRSQKAAAVLIFKDGKVLCATRRDKKGICGPGGHIKVGEKPAEAASREAYEEFGIYPLTLIPLGKMKASTGQYLDTTLYFCDRFTGTPKADGVEMVNAQWATIPELLSDEIGLFPAFKESIRILRSALDPFIKTDGRKDGVRTHRQARADSAYDEWLEENMDQFRSVKEERDFANWKNDDGFRPRDATDVDEVDMAWSKYQKRREDADQGENWVTINGTHVLIGEGGVALSGGKLKGQKFEQATSSNSSNNKASKLNARMQGAYHYKEKGNDYTLVRKEFRSILHDVPIGTKVTINGVEYTKVGDNQYEYIFKPGQSATSTDNYLANQVDPFNEQHCPKFEEPSTSGTVTSKQTTEKSPAEKGTVSEPSKKSAHSQEPPVAFKGDQVVDVSKDQFQSLRRELEANTGKAVSNGEVEQYLSAIDEYRGTDYTGVVAASAGFSGGYEGYSSMLDGQERARLTERAETVERFIASANKYEGKVMRAMGFDVGGEYGDGSWDTLSEKLRPGETLDMGHISSWTTDDHTVAQVLSARTGVDDTAEKSIEVVMTCNNSKSGADIGRFSTDFTQGEVIFGKGQQFRITSVKQSSRQNGEVERYDVTVEEV